MKCDKEDIVERRVKLLEAEGVEFVTNAEVGGSGPGAVDPQQLQADYDAVLLACGATVPRDLPMPNRDAEGIHQAMEFLTLNTKSLLDSQHADGAFLSAEGKRVVVIGGGDTGTDCIATSLRQGCDTV